MIASNIKSPGVYINEINAFPNSVVPAATAVPAFIGYTPQATYEGKSYANTPTKISSFAEFKAIFCFPDPQAPQPMAKQYSPAYYLVKQPVKPVRNNYVMANNSHYAILPDPNTIYYLYNSIQLFYQNGGADAYIVSIGNYGPASGKPMAPGAQTINANVKLNDLSGGIKLLQNLEEPTMYICPEATLLSVADNATLMQSMLLQCSNKRTAISIFDIIGGHNPDPVGYTSDITTFKSSTGTVGLDYGTTYYPFIGTTIMQSTDIDYTNFFGGDIKQLAAVINPADQPNPTLTAILARIQNPSGTAFPVAQNNNALFTASKLYANILNQVLAEINTLPPSGAMAGVITQTDNADGVWQAPANTSIVSTVSLPINLSDSQQGNLNVDPISGKSVNVIRSFSSSGILIWGARTLDGNSQDWKYLSVRRMAIFLEQSCKQAIQAYTFQPNDKNTWENVKAMLSGFLTSIWKQGGLMGATPSEAFFIDCGLGITMTTENILDGLMNITVKASIVHPSEYIVITLQQRMAAS